jgi:hypothetical protein
MKAWLISEFTTRTETIQAERMSQLTIVAVCSRILHSLKGTQTLFSHLAPVPSTFYLGLASSLETTLNHESTEAV